MPQHVKCPGCDLRLRYPCELDSQPGVCPECEHLILPSGGKSKDAADETLRAVKPIDDRLDDLRREGRALAREHGLELHAVPHVESLDKAAVEARLNYLKQAMPATESAYQPSGKLPLSALGAMLLGTGAAIGAALLAEFVVGVIAAIAIGLVALLNLAIARIGFIVYIVAGVGLIVGVIGLAAPFLAGGWTAARVTTHFGQIGKNRNVIVATLLSTTAAAVSILIVWVLYYFVGARLIDGLDLEFISDSNLQWIGHGVMGLGSLLTVFKAFDSAFTLVKDAKFCEECEEYMEETELRSLRTGAIHGMVLALQDDKPAVAASMLCSDPADEGKAMLYHCPMCDAGYVEVALQFKANWQQNGSNKTREETWRAVSVPLHEYDVEWFRIFKEQADDDPRGDDE